MKASFLRGIGLIVALLALNALVLWALFAATAAQATSLENPPAGSPGLTKVNEQEPVVDWIIATLNGNSALQVIDPRTDTVYGPFLDGELGSDYAGLFDVAVTPDGKTALICNFSDRAVYFVDVSNPISPSVIASVTLSTFPEDIDITSDGKFALVTDAGYSPWIFTLDVIQHTLVYTFHTELPADYSWGYHNSVDVGPDGTVVTADYFSGKVNALTIDDTGYVTNLITYTTKYLYQDEVRSARPVNAYIAPDGKTVLTAIGTSNPYPWTKMTNVYQVAAPGVLTSNGLPYLTEFTSGLPGGQQSMAFSEDGRKAYVVSSATPDVVTSTAQLSVLDLLGPGLVSVETTQPISLFNQGVSQWFGVDVIAVVGNKAYVGNQVPSGSVAQLAVVDLSTYSVTALPVSSNPAGIDVIRSQRPLWVGTDGTGSGAVTGLEAGIDCSLTCTSHLNYRTPVTLTAVAGPHSGFTGWTGACTGTGVCSLLMTQTKQVTATFDLLAYPLTVTLSGPGSGIVSSAPAGIDCGSTCISAFTYGTTVTLTATPDNSSFFVGWSEDCSTAQPVCVVPIGEVNQVTALFNSRQWLPLLMK